MLCVSLFLKNAQLLGLMRLRCNYTELVVSRGAVVIAHWERSKNQFHGVKYRACFGLFCHQNSRSLIHVRIKVFYVFYGNRKKLIK